MCDYAIILQKERMIMWHTQPYINRRNWILQNVQKLDVTLSQGYVILLLDYFNEFQIPVNLENLAKYTKLDIKEIDKLLNDLMIKGYVKVVTSHGKIDFDLSGVFDDHQKQPIDVDPDLFELFESQVKRPLSEKEMTQLSIWSKKHPQQMIVFALKEALIQEKVHFAYINKILDNWKEQGKSIKDFEND